MSLYVHTPSAFTHTTSRTEYPIASFFQPASQLPVSVLASSAVLEVGRSLEEKRKKKEFGQGRRRHPVPVRNFSLLPTARFADPLGLHPVDEKMGPA